MSDYASFFVRKTKTDFANQTTFRRFVAWILEKFTGERFDRWLFRTADDVVGTRASWDWPEPPEGWEKAKADEVPDVDIPPRHYWIIRRKSELQLELDRQGGTHALL